MTLLLDLIYGLLVGLGWPWLILRRIRRGPGSVALRERFGAVPSRPVAAHCVWLHGVSLGEINATRTIVAELHKRAPDAAVVISSTTQTGLARARELYPKLTVFRFPLDFSLVIRRTLRRVRPSVIVLMELEVWPNLVEVATGAGIPVLIANARVTESSSMRRFRLPIIAWFAKRMFRRIRWVGAQDQAYAERFEQLGVRSRRIEVVGSVKYDAAEVTDAIAGANELAEAVLLDRSRPLLACGSSGPGEETLLLDAYEDLLRDHPDLQLALVPRKPERFDEVARLIVERGFTCLRRSGAPPSVPADVAEPRAVVLGDTMGELRKFYSLATVVFVGRSLVPMGGSDVMEAAALAKPVIVGPHTENFAEPVRSLRDAGGCDVVSDASELSQRISLLLGSEATRSTMGAAARAAIIQRRGATGATVAQILNLGRIR